MSSSQVQEDKPTQEWRENYYDAPVLKSSGFGRLLHPISGHTDGDTWLFLDGAPALGKAGESSLLILSKDDRSPAGTILVDKDRVKISNRSGHIFLKFTNSGQATTAYPFQDADSLILFRATALPKHLENEPLRYGEPLFIEIAGTNFGGWLNFEHSAPIGLPKQSTTNDPHQTEWCFVKP